MYDRPAVEETVAIPVRPQRFTRLPGTHRTARGLPARALPRWTLRQLSIPKEGRRGLEALARRRACPTALVRLALRLALWERRWCEALEHAEHLRRRDPDDLEVARMLVRAQERLGFSAAALATHEAIVAASPEDGAAALSLAAARLRAGAFEPALDAIHLALARGSPRSRALLLRGRVSRRMGRPERAQADFLEAQAALEAPGAGPVDHATRIGIARERARPDVLRAALAAAVRGSSAAGQRARWLCELASLGLLDAQEQAIGRDLAASDAVGETFWFLPLHETLRVGRAREVAAALRAMPGPRRRDPAWCALLRRADPDHFIEPVGPAPRIAVGASGAAPAGFAAVCCHFNPLHWRSRLEATLRFRELVRARGVELLTVELAFGADDFELPAADDILQIRGHDVMWQKERLLNVGIDALLERGREAIAWLDADVVFEAPDWAERIVRTLERHRVCQAFDRVYRRRHRCDPGRYEPGAAFNVCRRREESAATGFAWAARAEALSAVRLYDAAVFGGADRLIHIACLPARFETDDRAERALRDAARHQPAGLLEHYRRWVRRWARAVDGDLGFVEQPIQTFFHGDLSNRYGRLKQRAALGLDPDRHLELEPSGAWRFTSEAALLREAAIPWLRSRHEDQRHALAQESLPQRKPGA